MLRSSLIILGLVALALAAFAQAPWCQYINLDDNLYVTTNWYVQRGLTGEAVRWAWTTDHGGFYIPLTWLSLQLDSQIFGYTPFGMHLTNVLLHAANTALLFLVLRGATGSTWRSALAATLWALHPLRVESVAWVTERKDVLSLFFGLAALWAYVKQRRHVPSGAQAGLLTALGAGLLLVALALFFSRAATGLRQALSPDLAAVTLRDETARLLWTGGIVAGVALTAAYAAVCIVTRRQSGLWLLAFLVALSLSLLAKPMLMTLPALLLVLDVWPLNRLGLFPHRAPDAPSDAPPLAVPAVPAGPPARAAGGAPQRATALRSAASQRQAIPAPEPRFTLGAVARLLAEKVPIAALCGVAGVATFILQKSAGGVRPLEELGILARLANAAVSFARYLGMTLWPVNLTVFIPYPEKQWPWPDVAGSLAALAAITALCLWQARRRPFLLMGWLWFGVAILPVIGLTQSGTQALADRFTYIPHIGLALMVAWAIPEAWGRRPTPRLALTAAMVVLLAVLGTLTWFQVGRWKSSISLFEHAVRVTRSNAIAHGNLGAAYGEESQRTGDPRYLAMAMTELKEALAINPFYPEAHNNLAITLRAYNRDDQALYHYQRALQLKPRYPDALSNISLLLSDMGRFDEAARYASMSVELYPHFAEGWANLGAALAKGGHFARAIPCFQRAIELKPRHSGFRANLGACYLAAGQPTEAIRCLQQALQLNPNDAEAAHNLARAQAALQAAPAP